MPAQKLIEGYKRVIAETYTPKNYFNRALTLINRLPDLKITGMLKAEPWRRKLAKSKCTNYPSKSKIAAELAKLFFTPIGMDALWFIIRSMRHGVLALPTAIELTFRGSHYFSVAGRIAQTQAQPVLSEIKLQPAPLLLKPVPVGK
jgi:hypothetical protein